MQEPLLNNEWQAITVVMPRLMPDPSGDDRQERQALPSYKPTQSEMARSPGHLYPKGVVFTRQADPGHQEVLGSQVARDCLAVLDSQVAAQAPRAGERAAQEAPGHRVAPGSQAGELALRAVG